MIFESVELFPEYGRNYRVSILVGSSDVTYTWLGDKCREVSEW